MSSYLNLNELASSPTFRGRIQAAIAVKAAAVAAEEADQVGGPKVHAKRRDLAQRALADPAPMVNGFVWLIVTNGDVKTLGHAIDDDALAWVVGWAWDQVAGVNDRDRADNDPPAA